jgi:hypothetical protein
MLQYLSNLSIYNNLRQDTHSLVRSQANYEWFKLHHSQSIRSLSKSERKQLKKFLESQKPALFFETIEMRYRNYLYTNNINTYTIDELDRFIVSFEY